MFSEEPQAEEATTGAPVSSLLSGPVLDNEADTAAFSLCFCLLLLALANWPSSPSVLENRPELKGIDDAILGFAMMGLYYGQTHTPIY
jgi:hypothetical protein